MAPTTQQMSLAPAPVLYPLDNNENEFASNPTGTTKPLLAQDNVWTYLIGYTVVKIYEFS